MNNPYPKQPLGLGGQGFLHLSLWCGQRWRLNIDRSPIRSLVTTPEEGCGIKSGAVESEGKDLTENV